MRYSVPVMLMVIGAWVSSSHAQSTLDHPVGHSEPYNLDSAARDNPDEVFVAVFEDVVQIEDAAWLRIYFGEVTLGEGSYIRMTSLLDDEVQELNAQDLAMWSNSSAYFNGDAVSVELIAGPGTKGNRLVIEEVALQTATRQMAGGSGQCGICGSDDRVPSSELWSARLVPAGCTASVWNTDSCMVSAGHCVGGNMVMQFNVPNSNSNCTLNNPPVSDQFPVSSVQFTNGGVGNDWSVMTTGTNNVGQTAYERYGDLRPISDVVGSVGQTTGLWGYGVDLTCTRSQTQQTSTGPIAGVFSTFYDFSVDLRGGNSGSGLILNGEIIGIVTHCPCPNAATRVDHSGFAAARASLCPGEVGTTTLPFFDDFPTGIVDPDLWTGIDGVLVSGLGQNVPSAPFSLNVDHTDEIRSAQMNTSGSDLMVVSYWWEQRGSGGEPGVGEDLVVEYQNAVENWIEINRHLGADPGSSQFEFVEIPLTGPARHSQFRLRFRSTGNSIQDDWFIDDVFVGTPPEDATTTLPFSDEFPSTEINEELWIGIEGASIDEQGVGEPSPILSLNIDGVDVIRSANMDTTGGTDLTLNYWWQMTGEGAHPASNNWLMVEYVDDQGEWVEINSHQGGGVDAEPYALEILPLPADALHANFRIRFRGVGTTGGQPEGHDDWFVDNVCVGTVGECQVGDPCGGPEDCDDGIPCTTDDCLSSFCVYLPANAACDDGVACTADVCVAGSGCENTPVDAACDDGNGCTLDSCDAGSGCDNTPDIGAACDDDQECTINDACDAEGQCTGENNGCVLLEAGLADLPICQDTSQDEIDVPLDVCNVYARLIAADDQLLSVGFADISTTDPNGFFQHLFGGNTAPDCILLPMFPALACDSFVTIGVTCDDGSDATTLDPDFDGCAFNCDSTSPGCEDNTLCGEVHGGWFNTNPGNDQGDPDENLRVLIAQFSVAQGHSVSGTLSAFVQIGQEEPPLIVAFPGLEFECAGGGPTCNEDCPTDVDGDGATAPFDLAFLLGCWGPVAPGSSCECLDADNDGEIGPFDLAVLLGEWGPCN